jgi:sortase (surface protein transpeptidase)
VTEDVPADRRVAWRRWWPVVAIAASAAAVVFVAPVSGLLGSSDSGKQPTGAGPSLGSATLTETPETHTPAPAVTMPRSAPVRLSIPAILVDSSLMRLGLKSDGTLETPPGAFPAGWFTGAPTPGELGPAIIVGHVRYETPGVFERLTDLRRDDEIQVERKDGSTARFRVTRVQHFAKSAFPTQKVYGNIDHAGLRLITCGGLDAQTNKFEENVVVFADLVT